MWYRKRAKNAQQQCQCCLHSAIPNLPRTERRNHHCLLADTTMDRSSSKPAPVLRNDTAAAKLRHVILKARLTEVRLTRWMGRYLVGCSKRQATAAASPATALLRRGNANRGCMFQTRRCVYCQIIGYSSDGWCNIAGGGGAVLEICEIPVRPVRITVRPASLPRCTAILSTASEPDLLVLRIAQNYALPVPVKMMAPALQLMCREM